RCPRVSHHTGRSQSVEAPASVTRRAEERSDAVSEEGTHERSPAPGLITNALRCIMLRRHTQSEERNMARVGRRGFVQASSALAAAPVLAAIGVQAQGPAAPDMGNLRVEKDIVFGKGGAKELTLDVYRPPTSVTSKRM